MNRHEIEQQIILTKEEMRSLRVLTALISNLRYPYVDKAQNRLNFVGTIMGSNRIEASARAIAKIAIRETITDIAEKYPANHKISDITFRWMQTSFLTTCGKNRSKYENSIMDLFYWNTKFHDTFKYAFIKQISDIFGECSYEAPRDIWACIWNFDLVNN